MRNYFIAFLWMTQMLLLCLPALCAGNEEQLPVFEPGGKGSYIRWLQNEFDCNKEANSLDAQEFFHKKRSCFGRLKPSKEIKRQVAAIVSHPHPWSSQKRVKLSAYLDALEECIRLSGWVKGKSYCFSMPEDIEYLIEITTSILECSEQVARGLIAIAWRTEKSSGFDGAEFTKRILMCIEESNYLAESWSRAEYIVASRIREMAYDSVLRALEKGLLNRKKVCYLRKRLDEIDIQMRWKVLRNCLRVMPAVHCDLIQSVTKRTFLTARFDKEKLRGLAKLFGYYDGPQTNLKRRKTIDRVLESNPEEAARKIMEYYRKCRRFLEGEFEPDYQSTLDKLRSDHSKDVSFVEAFLPLTNVVPVYEKAGATERKRRVVHLALYLTEHYYRHGSFPTKKEMLQSVNEVFLTDPVTQKTIGIVVNNKVSITCAKFGNFKAVNVYIPRR